jgi:putative endonuclease
MACCIPASHRTGAVDGFATRYHCDRLVFVERHDGIRDAIAREKVIKTWARARKIDLIREANPAWSDLYDLLAAGT